MFIVLPMNKKEMICYEDIAYRIITKGSYQLCEVYMGVTYVKL